MLLILVVQIRHLSRDLACAPGLVLPLKIVVVQGTPPAVFIITVAIDKSDIRTDSLLAPNLGTVGDPVQGGPLLLSDWNSPQGYSPLHSEWDSLLGSPLLNSEWNSPQEGPPLQSEWNSLLAPGLVTVRGPFQGIPLLQSDGDAPQGVPSLQNEWDSPLGGPLLKNEWESPQGALPLQRQWDSPQGASPLHSEWDSLPGGPLHQSEWDSLRGIPPLPNDNVLLRGTLLLLDGSIYPELRLMRPHLRDPPSRSSPTHPSSPSREDKEAEETSMPAPVKAMIDFILKSFPEATASPSHPSSRSFDLSASAGVTDAATPSGSLLAWCHAMSDAFSDTQKRFTHRIKDGKVCHTLLPTLNRFERVSNSPTQGKELKANPDVLDLLRNRVPDFRYIPISVKEGIAVERSLRSGLESHNFLTWSVMALIRSLHEKKLLPKDDPVISQLQKSFSKACSDVASCITSNTAFVTMKRRQLLLSHVVPSVSDAQKRNLLLDPFFQTSSLFAASSVEAARSAARDLSLFKPHLKASSSTSQSRRQPFSSSSGQRGPAKQSSRPSTLQRPSSPPRQQSGRKGGSRFQKKSSGTPQKRGSFRK